ncbi:unnamed protein product [Spirodela intermedia]|uniref:Uncharacterized protein n=1 Tax=Spirodela intermedia TaxID=51605 RepID=A0A7I8JAU2_SPIIN|nr:unnamed protein product [Spirodela intermedia]CAA6667287.1 unnamed protein product [Spirodela intermedia]
MISPWSMGESVDASLKTVVGAGKFVRERSYASNQRSSPRGASPRPPGETAGCKCRSSPASPTTLVISAWSAPLHRLLAGNFFYSLRKRVGLAEEWVYVIKRDRDGKISWNAFDPTYQMWQPLPPLPREYSEALGFGCAVLNGCHLYLFGGKDPLRGSMRRVIFFNARTNRWHRAPDMLRRRHCFGACVINNRLYIAGGHCEGFQRSLRSVEVYDPGKNRWSFATDMSTAMVPLIGVAHDGKCEVYVPAANRWSLVSEGMVSGWRNPSISMNGQLYALDCKDGCKLRIYDGASDSWRKSFDSKLHLGSSRAMEAAALVPLNGKLCIIRNNMSITTVDNDGVWETVAGKGQLRTFVTNLWSTIAGRGAMRSHIVHCQVLQA